MVKNADKKKTSLKKWLLVLGIMMLIFIVSNPDQENYYAWLEREYGISLNEYNYVDGRTFIKDGEQVYEVGHIRNTLFFTQRESEYYSVDDNELLLEIKTVGVLRTFFDVGS
ncbi:hypothetical protein [Paenibacillus sp. Marseille-Q4541]|uniref:hypothetical protein n=1 Tax=Paenibacillus sp. Marseille-Q4541 TaxID=2831522 RepID=UPI001BAD3336|nr:hypothetical protein [Paenibacillus sp. Marseille-Q4541]